MPSQIVPLPYWHNKVYLHTDESMRSLCSKSTHQTQKNRATKLHYYYGRMGTCSLQYHSANAAFIKTSTAPIQELEFRFPTIAVSVFNVVTRPSQHRPCLLFVSSCSNTQLVAQINCSFVGLCFSQLHCAYSSESKVLQFWRQSPSTGELYRIELW